MWKRIAGTVLILVSLVGLAMSGLIGLGALVTSNTISNTGFIDVATSTNSSKLGVYSDSGCTTALRSIQWGTLNPGSTATATMYVRNEADIPLTLSIQAANWNPPSAENYFTLSWNLDGILQPNGVAPALLTLNLSSYVSGITDFSFDIIITATQ
jgi:hypothetical protein